MKNKVSTLAREGILTSNPTLKLVLGTCPTLALTTAAMNGIGMGAAVIFVLVCSNAFISLLRNVIPDRVRIPTFVLIIATLVTIVRMVMEKFLPSIYDALGIYLPLIVVNCIILARAESFASKNPVLDSALDGLFMGIGFTCSLTLMGLFREVLGAGTFFGVKLWDFKIAFFSSSAGAFFTYGLFIAVFNLIMAKVHKNAKQRAYKRENPHYKEVK
jgi:electron transport complex, rnfABCDGE type, E subunit